MLKEKRLQTIQTTEKALELLQLLVTDDRQLNINDLAQKLQIGREEVLLLLVTMESRGMVSWDSRKKIYKPGSAVLEMVSNLMQRFNRLRPLRTAVSPH